MTSSPHSPEAFAAELDALATFAVDAMGSALPPPAEAFARTLLLDTLGALVGGTRYPQVQALREGLGAGDLGRSATSFPALMRLGAAATWLDADSGGAFHPQGHRLPPVPTAHPAPHVLPPLLQGAAGGVADDELVRVFAIATEIGLRFGTATSLRPGLHPHGLHGPVAAAVAASLLWGYSAPLTAAAMAQALSLPMAARLWQPMVGGTVRNAWTGLGSYYGARAAAEAPHRDVRADDAMRALLAVVTDDADFADLGRELGTRWAFLDSYLKPYACARWVHPALDALKESVEARRGAGRPVEGADIRRVEVVTFAYAASLSASDAPQSDLQARFSVPVCLATLALDGELHAAGFLPDRLARPEVWALARRVDLREDSTFTAALPRERPTSVIVTWTDGDVTAAHVREARGNPENPLSPAEVTAKFRANVDTVLAPSLVEECERLLVGTGESNALASVARVLF
ncbi:MmgE/PrpD family protein [Knoellia locipacati]|uniref:MmgE/PrpD family protein n=1 Tax=Knoellia locipacati TaxID=882824 RepID=UPI00384EB9D8